MFKSEYDVVNVYLDGRLFYSTSTTTANKTVKVTVTNGPYQINPVKKVSGNGTN